jgi:hypothetical protein
MTQVEATGQVGEQALSSGSTGAAVRQGQTGELVVQELHGRFYEQNYRGRIFSDGMGLTGINAATYTTATLGATVTPVVGVWNPQGSGVNVVIIEASLGVAMTALQATGPGGFAWATSTGNAAITAATNTPLSRKTLALGGAQARGLTNVAPTGLTNNLVVRFGSALQGGSALAFAFLATAAGMQTQGLGAKELFDGSLIVPPGGVLALLATTTPVAHSAVSGLVWEEVPI